MDQMAYCGLDCGNCDWRAKMKCPGCQAAAGKMFWGECVLAKCCIDKQIPNCGHCGEFPCDQLKEFSYSSSEHGDDGQRIRNLEAGRP